MPIPRHSLHSKFDFPQVPQLKIDARPPDSHGLTNAQRDMSGRVVAGIEDSTGNHRTFGGATRDRMGTVTDSRDLHAETMPSSSVGGRSFPVAPSQPAAAAAAPATNYWASQQPNQPAAGTVSGPPVVIAGAPADVGAAMRQSAEIRASGRFPTVPAGGGYGKIYQTAATPAPAAPVIAQAAPVAAPRPAFDPAAARQADETRVRALAPAPPPVPFSNTTGLAQSNTADLKRYEDGSAARPAPAFVPPAPTVLPGQFPDTPAARAAQAANEADRQRLMAANPPYGGALRPPGFTPPASPNFPPADTGLAGKVQPTGFTTYDSPRFSADALNQAQRANQVPRAPGDPDLQSKVQPAGFSTYDSPKFSGNALDNAQQASSAPSLASMVQPAGFTPPSAPAAPKVDNEKLKNLASSGAELN